MSQERLQCDQVGLIAWLQNEDVVSTVLSQKDIYAKSFNLLHRRFPVNL